MESAHKLGSCASTYTPSLSRLSPPAINKQIEPQAQTQTTTRLSYKHPILGPDPVSKEGDLEQPSTILIELPGKPVLEATSLRIADREPLSTVLLTPFDPVFNPLSGDIPQNIADDMDNKLYVGAELKQVSYLVDIILYYSIVKGRELPLFCPVSNRTLAVFVSLLCQTQECC